MYATHLGVILNSGLCSSHHASKEWERELNGLKLRHLSLPLCPSALLLWMMTLLFILTCLKALNFGEGQHGYNSFDHFIKNQGKIKTSFNQKRL